MFLFRKKKEFIWKMKLWSNDILKNSKLQSSEKGKHKIWFSSLWNLEEESRKAICGCWVRNGCMNICNEFDSRDEIVWTDAVQKLKIINVRDVSTWRHTAIFRLQYGCSFLSMSSILSGFVFLQHPQIQTVVYTVTVLCEP